MIIDIVDDHDVPIGTIERKHVLGSGKNFRTVHAFLKTNKGNFIIQKLPQDHPRSPNCMGSSVAGYLKAGETYTHAVKRKCIDEVGTEISNLRDIGLVKMTDINSTKMVKVFIGSTDKDPITQDPFIAGFDMLSVQEFSTAFKKTPEKFTKTTKKILEELSEKIFDEPIR